MPSPFGVPLPVRHDHSAPAHEASDRPPSSTQPRVEEVLEDSACDTARYQVCGSTPPEPVEQASTVAAPPNPDASAWCPADTELV